MSLAEKQGKRAVVVWWDGNALVYPLSGRGLLRDDPNDKAASELRVARFASAVGAGSSPAYLAKALKCFVDEREGVISLTPTRRTRGPAWEAVGGTPPITVSAGSSPEDLGKALKNVLSQCTA